jgi:hypothetical protein
VSDLHSSQFKVENQINTFARPLHWKVKKAINDAVAAATLGKRGAWVTLRTGGDVKSTAKKLRKSRVWTELNSEFRTGVSPTSNEPVVQVRFKNCTLPLDDEDIAREILTARMEEIDRG